MNHVAKSQLITPADQALIWNSMSGAPLPAAPQDEARAARARLDAALQQWQHEQMGAVAVAAPQIAPPPVFKQPAIPFHQRQPVKVRALGLVAKMLGNAMGVEIVFDPKIKTAATDCVSKVFLPVLTDSGTDDDADLLKGLVCHEAAHCAYTDRKVSERCVKESGKLAGAIRNMFEDARIEKVQSAVHVGVPPMIDKALQILVKRGIYDKPTDQSEPLDAVTGLLISGLRTKYLGQTGLEEHFPLWRNKCAQLFGDKVTRALWRLAMEVKDAQSNEDSYTLAKKTLDLIKDLADGKEPEEPQTGQGDGQCQSEDQGQDQGVSGQGQDQPQQGQGDGQDDDPNAPPQQGSGSQQQPEPNGKGKGQQPDPNEPSAEDKKKNAQSILDATDDEIDEKKTDFGQAADEGLDESGAKESNAYYGRGAGSGRNDVGKRMEAPHLTETIINRSRAISVRLGNELETLLEAMIDIDVYWTRQGRKVDTTKLSRVAVGNYSVFKHKDDREGLNTAFSLIGDISGSMDSWGYRSSATGGSPMQVTEDGFWAILQAVDRFEGIATSAAAFGTSIHPVKHFHETFRSARHYLWNRDSDGGGTDTHYAIQHMGRELMQRDEERKLLMVITDGMPSNVQATAAAVGELLRVGVEVAFLFIASDESAYSGLSTALKGSGTTFAVASSSDQLVRGIFEAVKTSITGVNPA